MRVSPLNEQERNAIADMQEETVALIKALCAIPAPSHHEERRAAFVKEWLEAAGAQGVYIDEALNVIYRLEGEEERLCAVLAHMDTVFPDMTPMEARQEGDILRCPGVGDDTANLAAMMMLVKYWLKRGIKPRRSFLFVANACEEGLGNLKGSRAVMDTFGDKIDTFWSLDGSLDGLCTRAVGSARYKITARTRGGHSYAAFGNRNAIHALAQLTCALYAQEIPTDQSHTTYNVGLISGGTSVNTIAQQAEMLYEYRSDVCKSLEQMEAQFTALMEAQDHEEVEWDVECVGVRPCGTDELPYGQKELIRAARECLESINEGEVEEYSGSTDCNIPLSRGVRAVCFGVYTGAGAHTREEWIHVSSLRPGMEAALKLLNALAD